jgi:signal transduction histidine kinase
MTLPKEYMICLKICCNGPELKQEIYNITGTFNLGDVIDINYDLVEDMLEEKEITFTKNSTDNTTVFADRNMINSYRNLLGNAINILRKGQYRWH